MTLKETRTVKMFHKTEHALVCDTKARRNTNAKKFSVPAGLGEE